MELDGKVIDELRQLAAHGHPPCELAALIGRRLGLERTNYRIQAIAYFKEAFHLSMADAMRIGAAPVFPGEHRLAVDVDQELEPILDATRGGWARGS